MGQGVQAGKSVFSGEDAEHDGAVPPSGDYSEACGCLLVKIYMRRARFCKAKPSLRNSSGVNSADKRATF